MRNFWLYYGETLVTGVRCASPDEAIRRALDWHEAVPCCSALFPEYAPFEIRRMILHSKVRE